MSKILVIEDNELNRILMRQVLSHCGHEILEAASGNAGIRIAREQKPDLIVLDLQMPVMNGYEVLKELHKEPELKDVKIIAVTALAMTGDGGKTLMAGFDAYVAKPFDTRRLPELIHTILSGRET